MHVPDLGVQVAHKGIIVQALADVALHVALVLPGKPPQDLEQGQGTGGTNRGVTTGWTSVLSSPLQHPVPRMIFHA